MQELDELKKEAIQLLKTLIREPSYSGKEDGTAEILQQFLQAKNIPHIKKNNNIIAGIEALDPGLPTCLLNSHHDTIKVVNGWTHDPFGAIEKDGKLFGLGANDAGASLVSLVITYIYLHEQKQDFNLILAATAEEENFGPNGIKSLIDHELSPVDFGIVGEPTNMEMAIAEKGLLVIDGEAIGEAGHAARQEGENAIYKAVKDIQKISDYQFNRVSETLGTNVMTVTQIDAGVQHNVVPDSCKFVIDLRVNELYDLEEAFKEVQNICESSLKARSFNNRPSGISLDHPLVRAGQKLGLTLFGSPTLSDQANLKFPTIKMGPGFSERSHTPDEYIYIKEVDQGIDGYVNLLKALNPYEMTKIKNEGI
ncbi:M20/M25/M40 family metallo-hydrolase [Portibacter marinus]|uniref:M20/M25/M40 family metallo-hydrolase n=1 Tax=Portibacter marinus TaxID=2898660 RepID=UPI001F3EBD7C|nr:M20/M25/M40 family metallo-hydrolase [Portibacter marinus]